MMNKPTRIVQTDLVDPPSTTPNVAVTLAGEIDDNGDVLFRFRLRAPGNTTDLPLDEFYRAQLYDLLKVVRLYSGSTPVLVDGFAFRREPERIQPLQPRTTEHIKS
jgi:hypothetical protein